MNRRQFLSAGAATVGGVAASKIPVVMGAESKEEPRKKLIRVRTCRGIELTDLEHLSCRGEIDQLSTTNFEQFTVSPEHYPEITGFVHAEGSFISKQSLESWYASQSKNWDAAGCMLCELDVSYCGAHYVVLPIIRVTLMSKNGLVEWKSQGPFWFHETLAAAMSKYDSEACGWRRIPMIK